MNRRRPPAVVRTDKGQIDRSRPKDRKGIISLVDDHPQEHHQLLTSESVRKILVTVFSPHRKLPSMGAIEALARMLEETRFFVGLARSYPPDDFRVRNAMETLSSFFEFRRRQAKAAAKRLSLLEAKKLLWAEDKLRSQFQRLVRAQNESLRQFRQLVTAMEHHDWSLEMDSTALMPTHERWYGAAVSVAAAFDLAIMMDGSRKPGSSSDGPKAKFTAAVMPHITGEHVTPAAVSKCLHRVGRGGSR